MAIPQPPLFGDYLSLGAPNNSNTTAPQDTLSQYFDAASTISPTTTQNIPADSLLAWSAPTTDTDTMPGHATGSTTIEVQPRRDSSSSAKSPSPHASTRTPSTASNKSSRSRASTSSKSSAPSEPAPAPKRRARSSTTTAADGSRRDKFLERNRVAASKCRQRKKEWVSGLEEAKEGLESHNAQLQAEYNGLLGEVSRMKNQIMAHASCHDPNIDKWIDNEARRFVQAPEPGEFPAGGGVPYGGFPDAGAPPFPMDYQFDEAGSRLSPADTVLSADMPGCLKDGERPVMRAPEAVTG